MRVLGLLLLFALPAWAQFNTQGYNRVQEDGVDVTRRKTLNFIGAAVTCADNSSTAATDCTVTGGGGGGSSILLDLGDDGANESTALGEIAVTGDTNSIFSEPTADKLLIAVGNDWPKSDLADAATALAADPTDCGANQYATTIAASGNLTCAQVGFNQLSGTATDAQIPDTITVNNATAAGTATALAANPTDCSLNQYATTIDAGGNLTCAQVAFSQLSGTASDAQIPNNITVDLATAATALAANGANCSAGSFPLGVDASGAVESCSSSITGNAATATALAANGANCTAGSFPLGVDASGAVESCSSSITGNAATATALAANGGNCSAGNYPLGVDASGAVESCTADDDVPESGDFGNLTGGAGITVSAGTVATASGETDFLATGALTCGAGTKGRMQVHTTPLQYCDNAATPTLQYAAYGNSTGQATDLNCTSCLTSSEVATIVSDETGTAGKVVFDTSPTFQTDIRTPLIYGGTGVSGDLTLQSTTDSARGQVVVADELQLRSSLTSVAGTTERLVSWAPTLSLTATTSVVEGVDISGTWTATDGGLNSHNLIDFTPTLTNSGSGWTTVPVIPAATGFYYRPTVTAGVANTNFFGATFPTFLFEPTFNKSGSGTFSGASATGFTSGFKVTDVTVGTRNGFVHAAPTLTGTGAVTADTAFTVGALTAATSTGLDIGALTGATLSIGVKSAITASGVTRWFLQSLASAPSVIAGAVFLGPTTAATAPSAQLHVQQQTLGSEVARLESVATNDDPNMVWLQGRVATTDATVTTLMSYTMSASNTYLLEARVVARRTGGVSGASDDGAVYIVRGGYTMAGGAPVAISGTTPAAEFTDEDQAAWACTFDVSGSTVRVRVTGAANNNVTWHGTLMVQNVGS